MQTEKRRASAERRSPRRDAVEIPSDVMGSYTGMSHDGSRPVQDADDL